MKRAFMSRGFGLVLFAVCLLMVPERSHGGIITVDPDNAAGREIGNTFPGVEVRGVLEGPPDLFYPVISEFHPSFNTYLFDSYWGEFGTVLFRADFTSPTDFVAIDMLWDGFDPWGTGSSSGHLEGYDAQGNLVARAFGFNTVPGQISQVSLSRPSPDIAFVLAVAELDDAILLDNLRFNLSPVPEPGSGVLLTAGAFLVLWAGRRARKGQTSREEGYGSGTEKNRPCHP